MERLGEVHTIHAGCNANHSKIGQLAKMKEKHEVPAGLDWICGSARSIFAVQPDVPAGQLAGMVRRLELAPSATGPVTSSIRFSGPLDLASPSMIKARRRIMIRRSMARPFPTAR